MSADSGVHFVGPGPFCLPVAQRAIATGHSNNGVTMTVYSLVQVEPRRAGGPQTVVAPISIQMTSDIARGLAAELLVAADKGDRRRK